jgi:hypothetical protein
MWDARGNTYLGEGVFYNRYIVDLNSQTKTDLKENLNSFLWKVDTKCFLFIFLTKIFFRILNRLYQSLVVVIVLSLFLSGSPKTGPRLRGAIRV